MTYKLSPLAAAIGLALATQAITAKAQDAKASNTDPVDQNTMVITASADASADGLAAEYPGGQVAEAGRAGILGNVDYMENPFSVTSYTNQLIRDREARSVGDVLQNDPGVRVARGFGNFQESYFIRGFILGSDDVAYNGLYSLLPRQYIATELFERVEVLRGASDFLTGATPSGGGIGGNINLLPKRAPNEPLNRITVGTDHGEQGYVAADIARRFGENDQFGVRVNTAYRDGETAIDDEGTQLGLMAVGFDWNGGKVRLSGDIGYQNNQLDAPRTNVSLSGLTSVLDAPDASSNWAQPWSYSNEEDAFGTFRGEFDITDNLTAWVASGFRQSNEQNTLANIRVTNNNGDGTVYRFDNAREDLVVTEELGLKGFFETGSVGHDWVVSASHFELESRNAYAYDSSNSLSTNLYNPTSYENPGLTGTANYAGDMINPHVTRRSKLFSFAVGDTLKMLDEQLLVTLGARYQELDLSTYSYITGARNDNYKKSEVTPAVGVVYKFSDSWSVYGNYIESLRQGETADNTTGGGTPLVNAGEIQDPYVAEQREIGVKFDSGDLGMGIAYFSTDKPRSYIDESDPVAPEFVTSGKDTHQGIELTGFGYATDSIKVLGGVTWLDAIQEDTNDSSEGNRVIGVPEFQANLGAEWEVPGVDGLAIDGRLVYTGSVYADNANSLEVPSWTRFDLGARYALLVGGDKELTLRARVNNLFDKDYWASSGGYENSGYLVAGAPRTITLSASIDF